MMLKITHLEKTSISRASFPNVADVEPAVPRGYLSRKVPRPKTTCQHFASTAYGKRQRSLLDSMAKTNIFTSSTKCVIYITYMAKPCNTQRAAKAAGIAVMTLHRWIVAKRLKAPKLRIRNGRAVRLWSKEDLVRLHKLKQAIYCRGRGRKKGYKK
jgi:hypothetical protein